MAEIFSSISPYAIALVGGVLPSLVWLWFWLKEDKRSPEPTGLIALSFTAGMVAVFLVLPIQKLILANISTIMYGIDLLAMKFTFIEPDSETVETFLWASTEEFGKFVTVFFVAYHTSDFDEPMDCVMYMITAALGFSAMENTLYLLKDMTHISNAQVLLNTNLRFLGATVIHILSSAILGIAFAFAFYRNFFNKVIAGAVGLMLAILLHTHFNLSIMDTYRTMDVLSVFARYWAVIVGVIILIHVVKKLKPISH